MNPWHIVCDVITQVKTLSRLGFNHVANESSFEKIQ
jgi:hypothetical protein